MRRVLLLAAAIFLSGAGKPQSSLTSELRFIATDVPNFQNVVPQAIRSCGASFIGFQAPPTEGVESVYFGVGLDRSAVVLACLQRQLPQVRVPQPVDHCVMPSCMPELIQPPPVGANVSKPPALTSPPSHSEH